MAVKKILSYPEAKNILTSKSQAAQANDLKAGELVQDLKDTLMATERGVGLAAPQIGVLKRVFVLKREYIAADLGAHSHFNSLSGAILVFINPKIISRKGEICQEEGCLSVPDTYIKIERAKTIKIKAQDETGSQFYERFAGLAARAIQQEIDHLDGILILNHKQNE
ncbi:MAG: peptide deformylase [Candidatus Omnitrophica bacterium]|nr:peptide deformylase [Candidatus Omnitrophota bacterium]